MDLMAGGSKKQHPVDGNFYKWSFNRLQYAIIIFEYCKK